jgi:hypothetical protein
MSRGMPKIDPICHPERLRPCMRNPLRQLNEDY